METTKTEEEGITILKIEADEGDFAVHFERVDEVTQSSEASQAHDKFPRDEEVAEQIVRNWGFFAGKHCGDAYQRTRHRKKVKHGGVVSARVADGKCRRTLDTLWRLALITATTRWAVATMAFLKSHATTLQSMHIPAVCGRRALFYCRVQGSSPPPDVQELYEEAGALASSFGVDAVFVGPKAAAPFVYSADFDRSANELRESRKAKPGPRRERMALRGVTRLIGHLGWYVAHDIRRFAFHDIAAKLVRPWERQEEALNDDAPVDETEGPSPATIRSAVARVRELVSSVENGYLLPGTKREPVHAGRLVRLTRPAVPLPKRGRPKTRRS